MKKTLLLLAILTFLGCAAFKQVSVDIESCWQDPICKEAAIARAAKVQTVTTAAGSAIPFPGAGAVVGSVAGAVTLGVGLWLGGKKKRQSK